MLPFRFLVRSRRNLNRNNVGAIFAQQKFSTGANVNVVRTKVPEVAVPNITIDELVWKRLDKWPNKTAMVCAETGRAYIYSDLYGKSCSVANFLHKMKGLKQGDTMAIVLPNVPEYIIVLLAGIQAGLKVTTVNPIYGIDEMTKQFTNSDTKLIFTLNQLWSDVTAAIRASANKEVPVVVINTKEPVIFPIHSIGNIAGSPAEQLALQGESVPSGAIKFDEISAGDPQLNFRLTRKTEDVVLLPYSSGTTGHPKGVELTNRNVISAIVQANTPEFQFLRTAEGSYQEVIPAILPMFHIYGMVLTLNAIYSGAKMVTVPKFGSDVFINVLETHKPTIGFFVPPIVLLVINHQNIRAHHLANMRKIASGAAPLGATDVERLHRKSEGKTVLVQGYGLTETSALTHYQTDLLPNGIKIGGCGLPIPNTECKIVPLDEEEGQVSLGPNESGELYVRGPQIMKGYHNNPKATQDTLVGEGWMRTGDIGYYDEDGHFFITDRLKELIKVKAFQVPPAELEELLRDHPEIQDAAVVGIPHREFGEVPKAFVVVKSGSGMTPAKVQDYVAAKVVKYKRLIGGVTFMESIPKTASGKILRRQLREL